MSDQTEVKFWPSHDGRITAQVINTRWHQKHQRNFSNLAKAQEWVDLQYKKFDQESVLLEGPPPPYSPDSESEAVIEPDDSDPLISEATNFYPESVPTHQPDPYDGQLTGSISVNGDRAVFTITNNTDDAIKVYYLYGISPNFCNHTLKPGETIERTGKLQPFAVDLEIVADDYRFGAVICSYTLSDEEQVKIAPEGVAHHLRVIKRPNTAYRRGHLGLYTDSEVKDGKLSDAVGGLVESFADFIQEFGPKYGIGLESVNVTEN